MEMSELVSPRTSSASSQILPPTTPKLLPESAAAPRLSVFETHIKPDMTQCLSSTQLYQNKLMEMDFLRSEKITLQKRIKCLDFPLLYIQEIKSFSFKFLTKLSDETFFACQFKIGFYCFLFNCIKSAFMF